MVPETGNRDQKNTAGRLLPINRPVSTLFPTRLPPLDRIFLAMPPPIVAGDLPRNPTLIQLHYSSGFFPWEGAMPLSRFLRNRSTPTLLVRSALAVILVAGLNTVSSNRPFQDAPDQTLAAEAGSRPLAFVPNAGQTDTQVRFQAQSRAGTLFFTDDSIVIARVSAPATLGRPAALSDDLALAKANATMTVTRLDFVGANANVALVGADTLPGRVNYFIGSNPSGWRTDLPTYGTLVYRELYPGIDLTYQGSSDHIKGTYLIAPGADPTQIRWRYPSGSAAVDAATGDLYVTPTLEGAMALGETHRIIERAPIAWQDVQGQRVAVDTRYIVQPDGSIGFTLPQGYDATQPLILDPTLVYATYLGGTGEDNADGIGIDGSANLYVSGLTASVDFPTTPGVYQGSAVGLYDVYVTKYNPAGSSVLYSTYLGGTGATDYGLGLAIDTAGNAYVTGVTDSTDFPTVSAVQNASGGAYDAFLAKLDPTGASLLYSTYFGGTGLELGFDVVVEPTGGVAYLTGRTEDGFPTAGTPLAATYIGGTSDGFVAKVATTLTGAASLPYATYIGGAGEDRGNALTLGSTAGLVYVTGRTASTDFPVSAGAFQSTLNGTGFDAYVLALDTTAAGTAGLGYASYLGGSGDDRGLAIARGASDNLYLTGRTMSVDFPTSAGAPDATCGTDANCDHDGSQSFFDAFVVRIDPALSGTASRVYGTYLGGERRDEGEGIVVNPATGEAHLTGYTNSTLFPTVNALQPTCGWGCGRVYTDPLIEGFTDAFVTRLNADGTQLAFSTYLGGNSADFGFGIMLDETASTITLAGETYASDFPLVSPLQTVNNGNYEVFVAKLDATATETADLSVTQSDSPDPVFVGNTATYVITVTNAGPDTAPAVRLSEEIPEAVNVSLNTVTSSVGACAAIFSYGVSCQLGDLGSGSSATVTVTVNVASFATPTTITSTVGVASNISDPVGANNLAHTGTAITSGPVLDRLLYLPEVSKLP